MLNLRLALALSCLLSLAARGAGEEPTAEQADRAVRDLGNPDFPVRESARRRLRAWTFAQPERMEMLLPPSHEDAEIAAQVGTLRRAVRERRFVGRLRKALEDPARARRELAALPLDPGGDADRVLTILKSLETVKDGGLALLDSAREMLENGEETKAEISLLCASAADGVRPEIALESFLLLGDLCLRQGRLDESERRFRQVLEAFTGEAEAPSRRWLRTAALIGAGTVCAQQKDWDGAQARLTEALARCEKGWARSDIETARCLHNLAATREGRKEDEEALALYLRALEIREKRLGKEHPDVAQTLNNLALLRWRRKELEAAEPLLRRAERIYRASLPGSLEDLLATLHNLSVLAVQRGRRKEAAELERQARTIRATWR